MTTPAPAGQTPAQRAATLRRFALIIASGSVALLVGAIVLFALDLKVPAYLAAGLGVLDLVLSATALVRAKAADRQADAAGPVIQEQ